MKRYSIMAAVIILIVALASMQADAQFRSDERGTPRVAGSMMQGGQGSSIFSFFNADNFNMNHSYSMSYMTMGGRSMSVGLFTSSLGYQFSESLDAQVDVSMMHQPHNTFNSNMNHNPGVFISRAALNYEPSENFRMQFEFRQIPGGSYYGYGSPFYNPWYNRFGY